MRLQTCLAGALFMLLPATSFGLDSDLPGGVSIPDDVGVQQARADKKSKKKRGKKNEPETPPPPPPDTDGDGVIDANDKCVDEPEDQDLFEDEDGCPDPDNDGDGIADTDDDCPFEAETVDGWTDDDGCPEEQSKLAPMTMKATLLDGTTVEGKLVRIVALDEDEKEAESFQPEKLGIGVGDTEFETTWGNVRSLSGSKQSFNDNVNCYSEGIQELGDSPTWECTLDHPVTVKLAESTHKGAHKIVDRQMHRFDFWLEDVQCQGESCDSVTDDNAVSLYLYKMIVFDKSEEESETMMKLQKELRALQNRQVKSATFAPIEAAE